MFAIRQKSTGYFLPPYSGRAGGTWVEPAADITPRLFVSRTAAKNSLSQWLKGRLTVRTSMDMSGDDQQDWNYTAVPSRKAEDMEIVEVQVVVLDSLSKAIDYLSTEAASEVPS